MCGNTWFWTYELMHKNGLVRFMCMLLQKCSKPLSLLQVELVRLLWKLVSKTKVITNTRIYSSISENARMFYRLWIKVVHDVHAVTTPANNRPLLISFPFCLDAELMLRILLVEIDWVCRHSFLRAAKEEDANHMAPPVPPCIDPHGSVAFS